MMKCVRVLHVVNTMNYAGIETLLMNIYRKIDKSKIQFDFLLHEPIKSDYEEEILEMGGRIYRIDKYNILKLKKYEKDLYYFFKTHPEYEIVHSHLNTFSKFVLKAATRAKVKYKIAHSHASKPKLGLKTLFKYGAKLNLNKYTDYKFSCSGDAASWLFGTKEGVIYFKNSIDTGKFIFNSESRNFYREALGVSPNTLLIGHVGNYFKEKNHIFIITVFEEVYKRNKNSKLLLIGRGNRVKKIKKIVEKKKLNNAVIFLEPVKNVNDYMQAMDIFLFPSSREGLGMVTIEAQASGLNVLASANIPLETKISPLINYLSLKSNVKTWGNEILRLKSNISRKNMYKVINKAGYDIHSSTKWLENFYLSLKSS